MLATGEDRRVVQRRFLRIAAVLLWQEFHCKVNTGKLAARNGKVTGLLGAARHQHGIETVGKLLGTLGDADVGFIMEGNTLCFHLGNAAVDVVLFHFEIGNAVTHEAAHLAVLFKQVNSVAGPRKLLGCSKARRAATDNGNFLSRLFRSDFWFQPPLCPGAVNNGTFNGFDGDRIVIDIQRTRCFARCRTNAAGEFWKIVGGMKVARCFLPAVVVDQIIPVWNLVIDRATIVAIGNAAIHAACRLVAGSFFR